MLFLALPFFSFKSEKLVRSITVLSASSGELVVLVSLLFVSSPGFMF